MIPEADEMGRGLRPHTVAATQGLMMERFARMVMASRFAALSAEKLREERGRSDPEAKARPRGLVQATGRRVYGGRSVLPYQHAPRSANGGKAGKHRTNRQAQRAAAKKRAKR
jgi:hypothetical protein